MIKNRNVIFFIEPDLLEKFLLRVGQESFLRHLARSWEDFCGWFCLLASGDMVVSNIDAALMLWGGIIGALAKPDHFSQFA